MAVTKKEILDKTHYGLNIYSYILRQHYPGETVLSLSGRDCKPTKNPFNHNKETLVVKIENGFATHTDLEHWEFQGDVFDFAELAFKLSDQELLEKINEVLYLRLDEEKSFYKKKTLPVNNEQILKKVIDAPMVSYFLKPVRNTKPYKELSLVQVYNKIRSIAFKEQTENLRKMTDKKEARKYKADNFDYVTFSGTFSKREEEGLKNHSGLLTVDLDHLENISEVRARLLQDEYFESELLFVSPSGDGLKWIIPIDLSECTHQEYFIAVSNYIRATYGITVDESGKDVSRACFLPFDPQVYINPKYL